jgi:hypothetical protein
MPESNGIICLQTVRVGAWEFQIPTFNTSLIAFPDLRSKGSEVRTESCFIGTVKFYLAIGSVPRQTGPFPPTDRLTTRPQENCVSENSINASEDIPRRSSQFEQSGLR